MRHFLRLALPVAALAGRVLVGAAARALVAGAGFALLAAASDEGAGPAVALAALAGRANH